MELNFTAPSTNTNTTNLNFTPPSASSSKIPQTPTQTAPSVSTPKTPAPTQPSSAVAQAVAQLPEQTPVKTLESFFGKIGDTIKNIFNPTQPQPATDPYAPIVQNINDTESQLDTKQKELDGYETSGDYTSYNANVDAYNSLVNQQQKNIQAYHQMNYQQGINEVNAIKDSSDTNFGETFANELLNNLGGLLKTPYTFAKSIVSPSDQEKTEEQQNIPNFTSKNPVLKVIDAIANPIQKVVYRAAGQFFLPAIKDIAASIVQDKVVPTLSMDEQQSVLKNLAPTLDKTQWQKLGDVVTATLAAFAPEYAAEGATEATTEKTILSTFGNNFARRMGSHAITGALFGVAQSLSSGSKDPAQIAQTMTQNITGMIVLGGLIDSAVPTASQAFDRATKQVMTEYNLPKTVSFNSAQVKDIWQTGKLLSDSEKDQIIKIMSTDKKTFDDAIKNGVTIKVPLEKIIKLQDTPLWAKVKSFFGIEPTEPTEVSRTTFMGEKPSKTVRGYLPATISSSHEELPAIDEKTGEPIVKPSVDALQTIAENVKAGKSPSEAAKINVPVIKPNPDELEELSSRFRQKEPEPVVVAPEPKGQGDPSKIAFLHKGNAFQAGMVSLKEAVTSLTDAGYSKEEAGDIVASLADKTREALGKQSVDSRDLKEAAFEYSGELEKENTKVPEEKPETLPVTEPKEEEIEEPEAKKKLNMKGSQAGFIDPAGMIKGIKSKIDAVNTLIEETQKKSVISGNIGDDLYKLLNARRANEQRLINFIKSNARNLTPAEQISITNYDEDKSVELTPKEQELYDNYVKPIKEAVQLMRDKMKEMGISLHDIEGEYTPHYVVGKNNPSERLERSREQGKPSTKSGGPLKKSVGDKHRTMRILTDENGNRIVASVDSVPYKITKGKRAGDVVNSRRVTAFRNGQPEDLGVFKLKTRGTLMDEQIKPLQRQLERLQTTAKILESIKTREPVSEAKLNGLRQRVEDLKTFLELERNLPEQPDNKFVKLRNDIENDIDSLNEKIADLETKQKNLAPYEKTSPQLASALGKIEDRLGTLYEKETNLSLSDIYEQLSQMADRIEQTSEIEAKNDQKEIENAKKKLSTTIHDIKILSNIKGSEDLILRGRRLATIHSKIVNLVNQIADIESKYDQEKLDQKVFVGPDGKTYRLGEATIKEIEANTNLKYSKNPIVNWGLAYQQTLRAYMANNWLENFKSSDEFNKIAVKEGESEVPEGWKTTKLPQFRGYYFEPRTAEVLDDVSSKVNQNDENYFLQKYDQLNSLILKLTLINPIAHTMNVLANYLPERGLHLLDPRNVKNTARSFAKAYKAVLTKNEDYLKMLEIGAPLQQLKETSTRLADVLLDHYTKEMQENKDFNDEMHKKLGQGWQNIKKFFLGIPKNLHSAAFFGGDLLLMQSIYQEAELRGISFEDAIKNITKYQADYRLPSRIGDTALTAFLGEKRGGAIARGLSQFLKSNRILAFSAYHLSGLVKPWVNAINDVTFNAKNSSNSDKIKALSVALIAFLLWTAKQEVQKELQKVTKNPNLYIKAPGMVGALDDVISLIEGKESALKFMSHFVTPSPAISATIQIASNRDWFTGEPIFGDLGEGIGKFGLGSISTVGDLNKVSSGSLSLESYVLSQFGIHTPSSTLDTPIQQEIMNDAQFRNVGEFAGTDESPASTLLGNIRSSWQSGNDDKVRSDLVEAQNQGYFDGFNTKGIDFKTATDAQLQKFFSNNEDALKTDVPPDVRAFSELSATDQQIIMDKMTYPELLKYGWYAATPANVQGTAAENEFAKAANAGDITKPDWIRGQIPTTEQQAMAKEGKKPSFPDDSVTSSGNVVSTALLYAKAIGTDPITAFNRMFTNQEITQVDNGTIFVGRNKNLFGKTIDRSEKEREEFAEKGIPVKGMDMDHIVALELGGSDNDKDNFQIISKNLNEVIHPKVENFLAKELHARTITKAQAREYEIRYKASMNEPLTPAIWDEFKNKYDSEPLTAQQIFDMGSKK